MMRTGHCRIVTFAAYLLLCVKPVIAELMLNDGGVHNIDYTVNEAILVDFELPGVQTTVNILDGASIWGDLFGCQDSRINVSGGWMEGCLFSVENSLINVSGGSLVCLAADSGGEIDILGGTIRGGLAATSDGLITIHGSDFAIDGTPVGYIELASPFFDHQLTGILSNGDPIDVDCVILDSGRILLVPEPGTVLLLGVGGLFLRRWR